MVITLKEYQLPKYKVSGSKRICLGQKTAKIGLTRSTRWQVRHRRVENQPTATGIRRSEEATWNTTRGKLVATWNTDSTL